MVCFVAALGFAPNAVDGVPRTEAYDVAGKSITDLMGSCWKVAKKLSLKRAGTKVADKMSDLMSLVPELIRDWQESSARGSAGHALAMCKAHYPKMDLMEVSTGIPKGTKVKQLIKSF